MGQEEGRGKKGLVTLNRMLLALAGRTNQIEAACNLWRDFRFERVTRFYIVDMAEIEKIQDCLLSSFTATLHAVDVQTKAKIICVRYGRLRESPHGFWNVSLLSLLHILLFGKSLRQTVQRSSLIAMALAVCSINY